MGQTPDRFPGEREDEGVRLEPGSVHPTLPGEIRYVDGVGFRFYEGSSETGLSGSGLTPLAHETVRQLIHLADRGPYEGFASGAYREVTGTAFPTAIVWWTSSAKTMKIVEKLITWSGAFPTTIVWKGYDAAGVLVATVTDSIAYSGAFETSRTRTIA